MQYFKWDLGFGSGLFNFQVQHKVLCICHILHKLFNAHKEKGSNNPKYKKNKS
jgi:hypothetical protein